MPETDSLSSLSGLFDEAGAQELVATLSQPMPFGRFQGTALLDLPEPYVVWFKNQGFPHGTLGRRLALIYEIKLNGLEPMLRPLLTDPAAQTP